MKVHEVHDLWMKDHCCTKVVFADEAQAAIDELVQLIKDASDYLDINSKTSIRQGGLLRLHRDFEAAINKYRKEEE